ncbi:MAG: tryptophan synthase subunit beta [Desulfovibrio sp.]|nr:tryptophan synthase subunit beta [Desulfovibrio sp.]
MTAHTATPCVPGENPDQEGFFGPHGGCFVPESLKPVLGEIARAYDKYREDPDFRKELAYYLAGYSGRQTPLFLAENLTRSLGGAKIYLKREDLNHLGAHKMNNCLGQILLAKRMGKTEVIAETGAGQHGVATAAVAALMGMSCKIFMGEIDVKRQQPNVLRMDMMGSEVIPVTTGNAGLKEAVDEAIMYLVKNPGTFYLIGSAVGPHPYPLMVRDFQSVIGREVKAQCLEAEGKLPDMIIAAVGGGSNAIGIFHSFIEDPQVRLVGAEPGGRGPKLGDNAATLCYGSHGVVHGYHSYVLRDEKGEVSPVHSISAGLDYPGVGPEHAVLRDTGRASYVPVTDREALDAFFALSRQEGIIPALESSHALAHAMKVAPLMPKEAVIVVNLSGRGDKDIPQIMEMKEKKS